MYEQVNIDELSKMLDINLDCPPERFSMQDWELGDVDECGTTHCLLGNYVLHDRQLQQSGQKE